MALPLAVYGLVMVQLMLRHDAPAEWPVLAAFVMVFPLVAAVSRLIANRAELQTLPANSQGKGDDL